MNHVEQVPAHGWRSWIDDNRGRMIDVREPYEWAMGTLPEAEKISLGSLAQQVHSLDKNQPLLLICRSGARSNQAAHALARAGYKTANLAGGLMALGMA
ncbi:MAG: rhodanese-like domain-containing protein [Acidimicrobiia bacterium]|jgi:rhodanese-related sulfurtransferase